MLKETLLALLLASGQPALKIDSCKGECDRNNKSLGEWRTDFIEIPEGEVCTPTSAVSEAIAWLEVNRPGFNWAGSACVFIKGSAI